MLIFQLGGLMDEKRKTPFGTCCISLGNPLFFGLSNLFQHHGCRWFHPTVPRDSRSCIMSWLKQSKGGAVHSTESFKKNQLLVLRFCFNSIFLFFSKSTTSCERHLSGYNICLYIITYTHNYTYIIYTYLYNTSYIKIICLIIYMRT